MISHPFPPVCDENSKILILGSFPSVKSRENNFYYGHPGNRFWKVLAKIFSCPVPSSIEEKTEFLLSHQIALWDVIASCEITGSSDSSIKNVTVNDIKGNKNLENISKIYTNGNKSYDLYMKYIFPVNQIIPGKLPSTSPANAAYSVDRLYESWKILFEDL